MLLLRSQAGRTLAMQTPARARACADTNVRARERMDSPMTLELFTGLMGFGV